MGKRQGLLVEKPQKQTWHSVSWVGFWTKVSRGEEEAPPALPGEDIGDMEGVMEEGAVCPTVEVFKHFSMSKTHGQPTSGP